MHHLIEAKNLVFGNLRFLGLELPESWEIAPGVSRPEINASHERGAVRWVVDGRFWYVVFERELGWALELSGRVRPLGRSLPDGGESAAVGGHPARVAWRTGRRGPPWKRHEVRYMKVDLACIPSERRVSLEFSGWCPEEGFRQVLRGLHGLGCH